MDDTVSGPARNEQPDTGHQANTPQKIVEGTATAQILENKEYYDLKRWEIGELASKIGQLYYHYYLRTSETNYLNESYVFYEAIRDRNYFKDVLETKNPALMVKKLRYFARFIVVCLLLNKSAMIKKLMEQLAQYVEDYNAQFKPSDYAEWNVVLSEISTFLEAEKKLAPVDMEGNPLTCIGRLKYEFAKLDNTPRLKLQEAILIKFSELTLDMYRMLQSLEREPSLSGGFTKPVPQQAPPIDQTTSGVGMTSFDKEPEEDTKSKRSNPRKHLLYRPTFAQLALYVATCFKDITENNCLMIYISADGSKRQVKDGSPNEYVGGIATAVNYTRKAPEKIDADQNALIHTFHPQDLIPFTRKPMFLIVDSNNSTAFRDFTKVFSQPFVCLMSPVEYPTTIKDTTQIGSLFSLFLHCPVKAFAFISDLTQIQKEVWETSITKIEQIEQFISDLIGQDQNLGTFY
ncbi:hypothetical protein HDV01_007476 [Terramyces sp. JEL0728]|nr:hypothetical protein HDV01_007476 [Terramyces sp. JEL0728]